MKPPPRRMHVLKGSGGEISQKRPVFRPVKPETIALRGDNHNLPDLICGSCGITLATGVLPEQISMAIVCNECDAVNDAVAKN